MVSVAIILCGCASEDVGSLSKNQTDRESTNPVVSNKGKLLRCDRVVHGEKRDERCSNIPEGCDLFVPVDEQARACAPIGPRSSPK